jgi:tetratricopeptide (TPR) repeat protein
MTATDGYPGAPGTDRGAPSRAAGACPDKAPPDGEDPAPMLRSARGPERTMDTQTSRTVLRHAVVLALICLLAAGAFQRNRLYRTEVSLWEHTVRRASGKQRVHHNYGCALAAEHRYESALEAFRNALALRPDGTVLPHFLHIEMGNAYFHLGRYDEALQAWRTALAASPGNPEVLTNMAVVLFKQGRTGEAAEHARRAMARPSPLPETLELMGDIAFQRGEFRPAAAFYVAAVRARPGLLTAYRGAVLAYERAGDDELAKGMLVQYLSLNLDDKARREATEIRDRIVQRHHAPAGERK